MPVNRINATLTAEQREKAKTALATLSEALPFLIDLGSEERTSMPKFGEAMRSFVVKALAIAEVHPEILPGSLSLKNIASTSTSSKRSTPFARPSKPSSAGSKTAISPPAAKPTAAPCWCTSTPKSTTSTPAHSNKPSTVHDFHDRGRGGLRVS